MLAFGVPFSNVIGQNVSMYACSVFSDSLWTIDTVSQTITSRVQVTLAGQTLSGMNDMAYDPIEHKTYAIARISSVDARMLVTVDLQTGVLTQVGSLGDKFSGLAFRSNGQLMGCTGDGASTSETLYTIDKNTGTPTLAIAMGNGADGEMIAYNWDDDMIYHWSGNGTVVFEKFPSTPPYTPVTNIPISGSPNGETFGALYLGNNQFALSNIQSNVYRMSSTGLVGDTIYGPMPNDVRSVVIPPQIVVDDTICLNDTLDVAFAGITQDTAIYVWGDGTQTVVHPAASATHVYGSTGNYAAYLLLSNDTLTDTIESFTVRVNNIPNVNLNPSGNAPGCDTSAVVLMGSSGGSSQWYFNGSPIVGADTNVYVATMAGVYNMVKTNMNGCSDSSSTSTTVAFGSAPVIELGADTAGCAGTPICFTLNAAGATYLWSDSTTSNVGCAATAGDFSVIATDSAGCSSYDTVAVTLTPLPAPAATADTAGCPTVNFAGNDANSTSWTWDFGDTNTGATANPSHTYAANGTYSVIATGTNQCGSVPQTISVTISCLVAIEDGLNNAVRISPNPSNGNFALSLDLEEASELKYTVTDMQGRVVNQKAYENAQFSWKENLNLDLDAGIYFLTVEAAGNSASFKLVIE